MNGLKRIATELLTKATDDQGAKSLAHLTVVVPTAQSGRRLRLKLAQLAGGALVPPEICLPDQLLVAPDDPRLPSRCEELLAMWQARGSKDATFDIAAELLEIRHILSEKALSFADVCAHTEQTGIDVERWQELAALEEKYYAALSQKGKRDRIQLAKARVEGQLTTRQIVRLDDPQVLLAGVGELPVKATTIHPCATPTSEAEAIAEYFAAVGKGDALPALCVADAEMFPEVVSAFETRGMKVHNPSRTQLSMSSLGHLFAQLVDLQRTRSYQVFSSFVRGGDARRWLKRELKLDDQKFAAALVDLDNRQAEFLPEKIDDIATKSTGTLRAIFEFINVQLRKRGTRGILMSVFKDLILDDADPISREFAAAAECVTGILDEIEALSIPPTHADELLSRRIDEASFSLEPDEGEVILSDGWLELPFLDADEVVVAGFTEGKVPEAVVGHPFLPDSLRRELGLTDNESRMTRDRAILAGLGERLKWISFHSVDAKGDTQKPSRLLFEGCSDDELVSRVRKFYGVKPGTASVLAAELPEGWKLKLPIPPAHREIKKLSPTRIDSYLKCPFTYYLREKEILGDKRLDDRAEELASWEYGNLAHSALEAFGLSEIKDSSDEERIRAFLEERVDAQLVERFGTAIPAIVAMQGESAKRRLAHFASIQAAWSAAGWKIVAVERKLQVTYGYTIFSGKCDRVDFNERTGRFMVIDYKTWDSAEKVSAYDAKKNVWKNLQLPIYCAMLDADQGSDLLTAHRDNTSACYCVLGKTRNQVTFTEPMDGGAIGGAEDLVRELISRIEAGIFWPPGSTSEWKWDYEDWLGGNPYANVNAAWIRDQEERRAAYERVHQ